MHIEAGQDVFYGTKSAYLNNGLHVLNHNGEPFHHNIRCGTVKTSCGHTLWFAVARGRWDEFFQKDGVHYIRETKPDPNESWLDPVDHADRRFAANETVVRSVICRWPNPCANRYGGEFQLVESGNGSRLWKRIATGVDLETAEDRT